MTFRAQLSLLERSLLEEGWGHVEESQHGFLSSRIVCPDWGERLTCGKPGEWARVDPVSARVGWGCSPVKPSCLYFAQAKSSRNRETKKMCLYDLCEAQGQGKQINGDVKSKWGRWHQLGRDMKEA